MYNFEVLMWYLIDLFHFLLLYIFVVLKFSSNIEANIELFTLLHLFNNLSY